MSFTFLCMNRIFFLSCLIVITSLSFFPSVSARDTAIEFSQKQFATCDELEYTIVHLVQKSKNNYWYPYMYAR